MRFTKKNNIVLLDRKTKKYNGGASSKKSSRKSVKTVTSVSVSKNSSLGSSNLNKLESTLKQFDLTNYIFLYKYSSVYPVFCYKILTYALRYNTKLINISPLIKFTKNEYALKNYKFTNTELKKSLIFNTWDAQTIITATNNSKFNIVAHYVLDTFTLKNVIICKLLYEITSTDDKLKLFLTHEVDFIYTDKISIDLENETNIYLTNPNIAEWIYSFYFILNKNEHVDTLVNSVCASSGLNYNYLKAPLKKLLACLDAIINCKIYESENNNEYILTCNSYNVINSKQVDNKLTNYETFKITCKHFFELINIILKDFYILATQNLLPTLPIFKNIEDYVHIFKLYYNNYIYQKESYTYVALENKTYINEYYTLDTFIINKLKAYTTITVDNISNFYKEYTECVTVFINSLIYILNLYNDYKDINLQINGITCGRILTNKDGTQFYINRCNMPNVQFIIDGLSYNTTNYTPITIYSQLWQLIYSCPLYSRLTNDISLTPDDKYNSSKTCFTTYLTYKYNNKALTELLNGYNTFAKYYAYNISTADGITSYKNNDTLLQWLKNCLELNKQPMLKNIIIPATELSTLYSIPDNIFGKFNLTPFQIINNNNNYKYFLQNKLNENILNYINESCKKNVNLDKLFKSISDEFSIFDTNIKYKNAFINLLNHGYSISKYKKLNKLLNKYLRVNAIPNGKITYPYALNENKPLEAIRNKLTIDLSTPDINNAWNSSTLSALNENLFIGSGRLNDIDNISEVNKSFKFFIDYFGITTYILINENSSQLTCNIYNSIDDCSRLHIVPICTTDFQVTQPESLINFFKSVFYHKKYKKGKIWMHCGFGAGRTGRVVIAYMLYEFFKFSKDTNALISGENKFKSLALKNFNKILKKGHISDVTDFVINYNGKNYYWLHKLFTENYNTSENILYAEPLTDVDLLYKNLTYFKLIYKDLRTILSYNTCDELEKQINVLSSVMSNKSKSKSKSKSSNKINLKSSSKKASHSNTIVNS
jgi:hypothetical protein